MKRRIFKFLIEMVLIERIKMNEYAYFEQFLNKKSFIIRKS